MKGQSRKNECNDKSVASRSCPVKPIQFQSEAFNALPVQQQIFILAYLKSFNGDKAAKEAKYGEKSAASKASQLLRNVNIQTALTEIANEIMNAGDVADIQEIGEFLSRAMRGSITDVVSWNDSGLVFSQDSDGLDRNTARLIKKVKVTEKSSQAGDWTECKTEIEVHDPIKAAELLGKYRGMFKEVVDHNIIIETHEERIKRLRGEET